MQRLVEVLFDGLPVNLGGGEGAAGIGELSCHSVLFLAQQLEWYGSSEVGLQELAAFRFKPRDARPLTLGFSLCRSGLTAHAVEQSGADRVDEILTELNRGVVLSDVFLHVANG